MSENFRFSPRENKAHEIKWKEWGEDAFKEAQKKNKLILLNINASWCYWCHIMDETAFSYKPNINLINDEFVPIRVDTDKRPDVNRIYNMGGWPTIVILTPSGEVLSGGMYMSERTLYSFLTNANRHYKFNKDKDTYKATDNIKLEKPNFEKGSKIDEQILANIDKILLERFDLEYGGFGIVPKFPHVEALNYLILRYFNKQDSDMFKIITKTLDSMVTGGIYDRQEGGFFRYSTTRDWSIPEFEKMLEDNSQLLDIYLKMYQLTGDNKYADVCYGVMRYINNNLLDKDRGVFFGSQNADEYYYSLDKDGRAAMNKPYIDKTIYTNWNAMAISAYTRAYYVLDNPESINVAQKGMSFLISNCFDNNHGMYHYYMDSPQMLGILEDQIYTINALIDLYEATSESKYIYNATNLADITLENYYDSENGGFYDDIVKYDFAPSIKKDEKSIHLNSFCAEVFYRLYDYSALKKYKEAAQNTIYLFSKYYEGQGIFAARYGIPVLRHLTQPLKISIVGDFNDKRTLDMFFESLKKFIPFKVVEILDVNKDNDKIKLFGYKKENVPVGYICKGTSCFSPVFSVQDILNTINNNLM